MNRLLRLLLLASIVPLGLGGCFLIKNSRAYTKTPKYEVVRGSGRFEIRDYPALFLATAPMKDDRGDGSFGTLFRYIAGGNTRSEKISMTTPVLIDSNERTMSFILPEPVVAAGAPEPTGKQVALHRMEPARYAVYRFAGGDNQASRENAVARLQEWVRHEKLHSKGTPIFGFYDPPWTPGFLRRNEVLQRIE